MLLFQQKGEYDRRALLDSASHDEARGKIKRAIAAYREVLEQEPGDHVTRAKLAPLLARAGEQDAAWKMFRASAEAYHEDGFPEKAISVYKRAATLFPRSLAAWERAAELELEVGRPGDSLATLMLAIPYFRRRKGRESAVALLHRAHALAPHDPTISLDYGCSLLDAGRRDEGVHHLNDLCSRLRGAQLRRARLRLLRAKPTPRSLWSFLRALGARSGGSRRASSR